MKETRLVVLSGKDLHKLLTMQDCVNAMEDAFSALDAGEVQFPLRTRLDLEPDNASALFMPVYSSAISRVCLKTVMNNWDNPARGLPFIHAMLTVFDSTTGAPVALMDGEVITAMRTGAVSGLATRLLAREDAKTAAVIGTGTQGETQLEAVCCVRNISRAYVFDLNRERAEAFAARMSERLGISVTAAASDDALVDADIICTATTSSEPVFDDARVNKGTHINGVGSYRADMAEIPAQTLLRAKVVVDQRQACMAEAGDLVKPIGRGIFTADHIHAELGELVSRKAAARERADEITVFKSVGIAVQDLVTADLALKLAADSGVGQHIVL